MTEIQRMKFLKIALVIIGVTFIFGIYALSVIWPSGWSWHEDMSLQMIIGIYAVLGIFLVLAAGDPLQNISLIRFTIWSSVVHGLIMGVQSLVYPDHFGHLYGDVSALLIIAVVLGILLPRKVEE
jgi:hypothetical protein